MNFVRNDALQKVKCRGEIERSFVLSQGGTCRRSRTRPRISNEVRRNINITAVGITDAQIQTWGAVDKDRIVARIISNIEPLNPHVCIGNEAIRDVVFNARLEVDNVLLNGSLRRVTLHVVTAKYPIVSRRIG